MLSLTRESDKLGICRAVWAVASGIDAVHGLAPRTCEGGDTSAHTGIGGSPSPAYLLKKGSYSAATISFHKKFEKYPKTGRLPHQCALLYRNDTGN